MVKSSTTWWIKRSMCVRLVCTPGYRVAAGREGRVRGGERFGEMEAWALEAYGVVICSRKCSPSSRTTWLVEPRSRVDRVWRRYVEPGDPRSFNVWSRNSVCLEPTVETRHAACDRCGIQPRPKVSSHLPRKRGGVLGDSLDLDFTSWRSGSMEPPDGKRRELMSHHSDVIILFNPVV